MGSPSSVSLDKQQAVQKRIQKTSLSSQQPLGLASNLEAPPFQKASQGSASQNFQSPTQS